MEDGEFSVNMEDGEAVALESFERKIFELSEFPAAKIQHSIYKVHEDLRNVRKKAYEPVILAVGPYHCGKDNLKMMEQHKLRYLKALVVRKPDVKVENYISTVAQIGRAARDCYAEPISLSPAKFIEMLVLDGCFIIELMLKYELIYSPGTGNDPIFETSWMLQTLQRDLLLFENQIPFFVLCNLFDLIEAPNQHNRLMELFLIFFENVFPLSEAGNGANNSSLGEKVLHLIKKQFQSIYPCAVISTQDVKQEHDLLHTDRSSEDVKHILDLLHSNWSRILLDVEHGFHLPHTNLSTVQEECIFIPTAPFIPTATELREANVKFRVSKEAKNLFHIGFENGTLSMPPVIVEDRTESVFRNLIAYEQYFPYDQPTSFTDYARLLDCLINSSTDVQILRRCGIIETWLGDTEAIVRIFNQITNSVTLTGSNVHGATFHRINAHYRRKRDSAIAKLKRELRRYYINSRWAYISFFAAVLLLLLTIAQTVLSALQIG